MTEQRENNQGRSIKCVVWDLDNTLWDGVLLEDEVVRIRPGVADVIRKLDERGILHSVASRNDADKAIEKLRQFQLYDYFLYPQISWNSKASAVAAIAQALNIGLDSLAFVDDDPFERGEVHFSHPKVLCIDAADSHRLGEMPEFSPDSVTADSTQRRQLYLRDIERSKAEESFLGTQEEFLATLDMTLSISRVQDHDLERAQELTSRTHQLNSTGATYSIQQLSRLRRSESHELLIAGLSDKFGAYGKIGLALIERRAAKWTIKLLLVSCRVMARGIGTILLYQIMARARDEAATLLAEYVPNDRNRVMYVTYKFAGFKEIERRSNLIILQADLEHRPVTPSFVRIV
jgi:FkbH-like protein